MQKVSLSKGFTLIELLVVIAIIGILAAVVLIAINPAERIKEANDSGAKGDLSQVAGALESCFTASTSGVYDSCYTPTLLLNGKWLKTDMSGRVTIYPATGSNVANVIAYVPLTAASAKCDSGTGALKFAVYHSSTGKTQNECLASGTPTTL